MQFIPEEIEQYAESHSEQENSLLEALTTETWQKVVMPRMLSGHLQGRFLSMLSHLVRPQTILEIGTYTGYSAICLAEGLSPDGKLITIDINDELKEIQDKFLAQSPRSQNIERLFGNALHIIPTLGGEFDVVFIDADKENYLNYYDLVINRIRPGGLLIADNVLWSGKVLSPAAPSDLETRILQEFNQRVTSDPRVQNLLMPLRDGLMLARKK